MLILYVKNRNSLIYEAIPVVYRRSCQMSKCTSLYVSAPSVSSLCSQGARTSMRHSRGEYSRQSMPLSLHDIDSTLTPVRVSIPLSSPCPSDLGRAGSKVIFSQISMFCNTRKGDCILSVVT